MQEEYCKHKEKCFTGSAPSVARVSRTFGESVAETWLSAQIFDLAKKLKVLEGTDAQDFDWLARVILGGEDEKYGDFKLTEFMFFFQNFKRGKYERFYGHFDPHVVTRSLRQFKAEREALLKRYEDKRRQQERQQQWAESQRNSLTYEEWQELRWLFNMGYERKDLKQN